MKCEDCVYFEEIPEEERSIRHGKEDRCEGRCHRRIAPVDGHIFAAVYKTDWCGEYEEKD